MLTFGELSEGLTGILWTIFLSFFIKIKLLHNKNVKKKKAFTSTITSFTEHTHPDFRWCNSAVYSPL